MLDVDNCGPELATIFGCPGEQQPNISAYAPDHVPRPVCLLDSPEDCQASHVLLGHPLQTQRPRPQTRDPGPDINANGNTKQAKQSKAKQRKAKHSKAQHNKAKPGKAKQSKAKQGKATKSKN